jgi:hypothetical protein
MCQILARKWVTYLIVTLPIILDAHGTKVVPFFDSYFNYFWREEVTWIYLSGYVKRDAHGIKIHALAPQEVVTWKSLNGQDQMDAVGILKLPVTQF